MGMIIIPGFILFPLDTGCSVDGKTIQSHNAGQEANSKFRVSASVKCSWLHWLDRISIIHLRSLRQKKPRFSSGLFDVQY